jgi:hypothetical protein
MLTELSSNPIQERDYTICIREEPLLVIPNEVRNLTVGSRQELDPVALMGSGFLAALEMTK